MLLWFGGDNDSPLGAIGAHRAGPARADSRPGSSRWRSHVSASTRRTQPGAEICGNPESLASALLRLEAGLTGDPDAGQPGERAALHRQAVQRRGLRLALLDASADRGAGSPAPPDAAASAMRVSRGKPIGWAYRVLQFGGRLLASLEPDEGREHRPRPAARGARRSARASGVCIPARHRPSTATSRCTSSTSCSRGRAECGSTTR